MGIQTAKSGGILDFSAKTPNILSKKIKVKARQIPMARFIPIPPRRFIEETATAIMVKINAETGILYFLYKNLHNNNFILHYFLGRKKESKYELIISLASLQ